MTATLQRVARNWQYYATTAAVVILAAVIRLTHLDRWHKILFDETYYVKDAYSQMTLGYPADWVKEPDPNVAFASGDFSAMTTNPAFVVHPPLGKALISVGMGIFGADNPFGWRVMAALFGTLGVWLTCAIAWQLFRSVTLVAVAGVFTATDTLHVAMSRIGLLDVFLATLVLAGFWTLAHDFRTTRPRLADALWNGGTHTGNKWHIGTGFRWWLVLSGVFFGAGAAVKWSAAYALALCGLFIVVREVTARWQGGFPVMKALGFGVLRGGVPAFLYLVPPAVIAYIVGWLPWFMAPGSWGRGATGQGLLADWVRYQRDILTFHKGVTSPHPYQANPLQWLLDLRPTSMVFEKPQGEQGDYLVQAVTALGNPLLWWTGLVGLATVIGCAFALRDWRAGFILCGYLGLWAPWLLYWSRTVFMFYMVVLSPFVALALTYTLGVLFGHIVPRAESLGRTRLRLGETRTETPLFAQAIAVIALIVVLAGALFFLPLGTGSDLPYSHWQWRMWLPNWI
ncbi:MAG: phospholipid carrier-dependent glycosyltransferase [Varibaculum sp.]|nr:phospholipid carrier-dependent glycosyltransferase [Varibaculum sp.]